MLREILISCGRTETAMKGMVAEIALEGATFAFDKLYTYLIPPELQKTAAPGCRAIVPFGRGNTKKQCMIFRVSEGEIKGLKKIITLIDVAPVLTPEMLDMCEYMHESIFCTYYDAVHSMLPAGLSYKLIDYYSANTEFSALSLLDEKEKEVYEYLKISGEKPENIIEKELSVSSAFLELLTEKQALIKNRDAKRRMGDATQKWVSLASDEPDGVKLTPRQREIVNLISDTGSISIKEIQYFTGVSLSVINNLIEKNVLISFEKQVFRAPCKLSSVTKREEIILTDEQETAYNGLFSEYKKDGGAVSLLYGITGSGKTQVFLKLVDTVSDSGRGVIVMVPEIALTPQMIDIFAKRYGNKIAVFHSAMSMGQRMDEWQRIRNGRATVAIGTRSAIFAPFRNLGLIIIDEEQEHTYKSEKTPRFNARELAKYRTAYNKGLLCLASATPSVESYTAAKSGKYSFFHLTSRYGKAVLPEVETVDMRKEIVGGNTGCISNSLYRGIAETLENKKQVILLLNRRGHNTYISCPDCGYVASCPNCSVSLTYHSANHRLMCHYCGYSVNADKKCPECGKEHMKYMGIGTQKAEEELKILFPDAKILRVDADSTLARESYASYMSDFAAGKYDILLGTQMVAKGLDFPNVTLVGVLGADQSMYSEDYRSFERTFSLLTQVVGRAGRGDNKGKAVIQTVNPDGNIIELAKNQDYDSFYEEEIMTRKLMIYPPYCDICVVAAASIDRSAAEGTINGIFGKIKEMLNSEYNHIKIIILGPAPASIPRINNKYRYRMIIKCRNNKKFRSMLRDSLNVKMTGDTSVSVDINPETII